MRSVALIYGLPGTGKTSICEYLLNRGRFGYLATDSIWQELFENPTFTTQESERVFQEITVRLEQLLVHDVYHFILVEGVFASASRVTQVKELCLKLGYLAHPILLICDEATALARVTNRENNPISPQSWNFLAEKFDSASLAECIFDTSKLDIGTVSNRLEQYLEGI